MGIYGHDTIEDLIMNGITNKKIERLEVEVEKIKKSEKTKSKNTNQGTTRQTTLVIHYLREAKNYPKTSGSNTADAEFIQFLTGRNKDEIRKLLGNPLKRGNEKDGKATKLLIEDLKLVRDKFNSLQLYDEIALITEDIKRLDNDLDSFK